MKANISNITNMSQRCIIAPAPVLNTPNFTYAFGGNSGSEVPCNEHGLPYHYEFVALPGDLCTVIATVSKTIAQVVFPFYSTRQLYVDLRFTAEEICAKKRTRPNPETILQTMLDLVGAPYVWGGNWSFGIPELLDCYPPKGAINAQTKTLWTLKGVDCSGLFYQATNGTVPRNTSALVNEGKSITISELIKNPVPLDMLVYPGHVLFVIDKEHVIESRHEYGQVAIRSLPNRLSELTRERTYVPFWTPNLNKEKHFTIRRQTLIAS
ncbi:MAG: hypothetical protein RL235_451 [Chlamydiota bacterium]|jgi:hypothetical protein